MRILPMYYRVQPVPPLLPMLPPPPKKDEPEEPLSFCGRLNRLMEVHRRHLMFERMMNLWTRMTCWLGFGVKEGNKGLNRII